MASEASLTLLPCRPALLVLCRPNRYDDSPCYYCWLTAEPGDNLFSWQGEHWAQVSLSGRLTGHPATIMGPVSMLLGGCWQWLKPLMQADSPYTGGVFL
jgi:hypothetical protein